VSAPAGQAPRPRPHWLGTLLYPAGLLAIFLGSQVLLGVVGVPGDLRAALAAGPALAALLLSLPLRLRRVWGDPQPWRRLGVRQALARPLLRGTLKAVLLLLLLEAGLAWAGAVQWRPELISPGLLLNGLALGLGVGFAEELLFRGWLLGELDLLVGPQRGLWLQAALFSLVHTRFNLPPLQLAGLLGGLLLLGLALGLQRRADGGSLWGAVGLHGGLVGIWFVLNQGLLPVNADAPAWLAGPANPIGGVLGWLGLGLLLWARRRWWTS
jgi:membrane protease YdiL (CAAX protease family)